MQRFKFSSCSQQSGKSIAAFVAELRKLAKYCNFQATIDDMLKVRLIYGITDGRLQCCLLAELQLTLKDTVHLRS